MAHIFVIDDEPIVLELISAVLQLAGHDVETLADPDAALRALNRGSPSIDLLITDADMQTVSGFHMMQHLREECIACPVIFMSSDQRMGGISAESLGRKTVIGKPFTASQLRSAVQNALAASPGKPIMPLKKPSVLRLAPQEQRLSDRRLQAVEEILMSEYDAAHKELDQVEPADTAAQVRQAVERYGEALKRMREFLAQGKIPPDVAQKLDQCR
jgi:CheY-like chemotaxis protein